MHPANHANCSAAVGWCGTMRRVCVESGVRPLTSGVGMFVCARGGLAGVGAPEPAPAGDPRALVCEWVAVTSTHDGVERTVAEGAYVLAFTADGKMVEARGPGGPRGEGTYKADPKA